jgi:hypothetical protein
LPVSKTGKAATHSRGECEVADRQMFTMGRAPVCLVLTRARKTLVEGTHGGGIWNVGQSAQWPRLVAKDEIAMDRGLRAQLSPNEMNFLRHLKLGARTRLHVEEREFAQLKKLDLIPVVGDDLDLTPLGRVEVGALHLNRQGQLRSRASSRVAAKAEFEDHPKLRCCSSPFERSRSLLPEPHFYLFPASVGGGRGAAVSAVAVGVAAPGAGC